MEIRERIIKGIYTNEFKSSPACIIETAAERTGLRTFIRRQQRGLRNPYCVFDKIFCVCFVGFRVDTRQPHHVDRPVNRVEKNSYVFYHRFTVPLCPSGLWGGIEIDADKAFALLDVEVFGDYA